jgi:hypothetical protein
MENQIKKRGGRIKGTPNKITTEIREFYKERKVIDLGRLSLPNLMLIGQKLE